MNFLIPASCSSDGASTYVRTAELSFCSGVFSSSVKALYTSSNKLTSLLSHKSCKKFANTVLSGNNGGLSDQEVIDTLANEITASAVK